MKTPSRSVWPFAAMTVLGLGVVPLPGEAFDASLYAVAAAVFGLVAVLTAVPSTSSTVIPALVHLVGVGVLREAVGGAFGGVGALGMLPVLWMALYGTRAQLAVVIGGMAVMWAGPLLTVHPDHSASAWRAAILFVSLSVVVGTTVERLVCTVREQAEAAGRLALTDALTALPNRRAWDSTLAVRLAAREGRAPLCVALLDLDGFKALNDRFGHHAGDRALQEVARAWSAELRPGDLLARIGGDEFAVLLADCDLTAALSVLERLRASTPPPLTCSAGVVEDRGDGAADVLVDRADRLLYEAKQRGRDRIVHESARLRAVG